VTSKTATASARKPRRLAGADSAPPTREVILDTAEHLFAARGVDGVALRDLAREMHLTAPSLYNHFPSKQALYDAVLERGLRPIVDILAAAWHPGALRPESMRTTLDNLTAHLATHPHLARLLQRALLEGNGTFQNLIARWLGPLYEQGMAVVRATADAAGWEPDEVPHLTIGLFGLVFAYFTNAGALQTLAGWSGDPNAARMLTVQRRFLEKAVYRLLGSRPRGSKKRPAR
jgi:AcrR family transcriptional regulator